MAIVGGKAAGAGSPEVLSWFLHGQGRKKGEDFQNLDILY